MESLTPDRIFDLAVIGAGPAGTSAAITASWAGFEVVLFEAGSFPRHKVCGEFISGEALPILSSLLSDGGLLPDAPRIENARIFLDGRKVDFIVQPAAISLSRHVLDLNLWKSAIGTGVHGRDRTRITSVNKVHSLFSISSEGETLRARAVINATGRWSNLVRSKRMTSDHWIGLKQHFFEDGHAAHCDLYFFPGGYCGVQSLGNGTVNAAAMVRADAARNLASVFQQNPDLAKRSRTWRPATESVATSPLLFSTPRTSDAETILVGDAAAFIDPFAGDGISIALHSGRLAALTLAPYLRHECSLQAVLDRYDRAYRDLLEPALRAAARLRSLLQLPKALRLTALSLIQFPPLARLAVQKTRLRKIA